MTFARAAEQDLARPGYFETFGHGLFCLNAFGASHRVLSFEQVRKITRSGWVMVKFGCRFELLTGQPA